MAEVTDMKHINQTALLETFVIHKNVTEIHTEPYEPMISDEAMAYCNLFMNIIFCGILAFFGTVNNIVNMIIFFQLGLNDSMSLCLFSLAVTDFFLCFLVFTSRAFPIWDTFFVHDTIDPMSLWYASFGWLWVSLFSCSGWITTYLSVERCVCVNFPFKVKEIFTLMRSLVAIILIYIVNAALFIPVYLTHWLEWVEYEVKIASNATYLQRRLVLKYSENRALIIYYVEIFAETVMPVLSLVVILTSVVWMVHGLRMSSKVRDSMTAKNEESQGTKQSSRLTYKTRKLVKAVLVLALIVSACSVTIPMNLTIMMFVNYPEISHSGSDTNTYHFLWNFTNFVSVINSSVNIIVYLAINTSYREKFQDLFSFRSCGNNEVYKGTQTKIK